MLAFYDQSSNPAEAYSLSVTFALEKIEKQKKRPGSAHEKNSYDDTVRLPIPTDRAEFIDSAQINVVTLFPISTLDDIS